MRDIPFKTIWLIIKIFAAVQIFNAAMDYYMWIAYGYLVPSWALASLMVTCVVLVFTVKAAQEKEAKQPPITV
ncbi:MAG TPA: hypothetical protein V6C97_00875 [Oculatellaceae cyanobacterium]